MTEELFILKIGGSAMNNSHQLDQLLDRFVKIPGAKILVHGGGGKASEISQRFGLVPKMVNGRRITDEATLEIVTMVYAGLVNKKLVAQLQSMGVNAIGLSGADGNIIQATKRPSGVIDYGFAGDLKDTATDSKTLELLLHHGLVPVCCPLTHDGQGQLLNTNADTIARHLGIILSRKYKVTLVFCMDKPGVLLDPKDHSTVQIELDPQNYQKLVSEGTIVEGMIPKLDNAFAGLRLGIKQIFLCDWQDITGSSGTKITL